MSAVEQFFDPKTDQLVKLSEELDWVPSHIPLRDDAGNTTQMTVSNVRLDRKAKTILADIS